MPMSSQITSPKKLKSLAVVVPRFGKELGGGAEALIAGLVSQIKKYQMALSDREKAINPILANIDQIEVWTTCAKDHRSWENFYPPGMTIEEGIPVLRCPVDKRDLDVFVTNELALASGKKLHLEEQLAWLGAGVNSKQLYSHIAANQYATPEQHADALLFAPYLFPTTFWGAMINPAHSILLPCLHDEAYAYQDAFSILFKKVRGIICNANAEAELVKQLYGRTEMSNKVAVVGLGFDPVNNNLPDPNINDTNIDQTKLPQQYLIYSGRKEEGKNLHKLIEWFSFTRKTNPELSLVLIGAGEINFLAELPQGVIDYGFVSEVDKQQLMQNALALCQLSVNESFSIVLMESWLQQTPVIVHGQSAVTREHAVQSRGGLYCTNQFEFQAVVDKLATEPLFRSQLGSNGHQYVTTEYAWSAVLQRLESAFAQFGYLPNLKNGQLN